MKPLDRIFEQQASALSGREQGDDAQEHDVFVFFETTGGAYAVPVSHVREIADSYSLTPYPEEVAGHLGVVSLRGQVLPVIAPRIALSEAKPANKDLKNSKLLILEFSSESIFCLPVTRVRKVLVTRAEKSTQSVLNVDGRPARVVTESDLIGKSEVA